MLYLNKEHREDLVVDDVVDSVGATMRRMDGISEDDN